MSRPVRTAGPTCSLTAPDGNRSEAEVIMSQDIVPFDTKEEISLGYWSPSAFSSIST